jgi:hypothetical protein
MSKRTASLFALAPIVFALVSLALSVMASADGCPSLSGGGC